MTPTMPPTNLTDAERKLWDIADKAVKGDVIAFAAFQRCPPINDIQSLLAEVGRLREAGRFLAAELNKSGYRFAVTEGTRKLLYDALGFVVMAPTSPQPSPPE
jgi:hypothetical protein